MIVINNKEISIEGTEQEVFINLIEIFNQLSGKMEIKLTDKAPEWLKKYIADFNNCIEQSPEVLKLLLKEEL